MIHSTNELLGMHHLRILRTVGRPVSLETPSGKTKTKVIGMLDRVVSRVSSLSDRVIVFVQKEQAPVKIGIWLAARADEGDHDLEAVRFAARKLLEEPEHQRE